MAEKQVLRKLLRVRKLQEEECRAGLERVLGERSQFEKERTLTASQASQGRLIFANSVSDGDTWGRSVGLIEVDQALRRRRGIETRLHEIDQRLAEQQAEFLNRRKDRRQVEKLEQQSRSEQKAEAGRRAQQMLDDWYGRGGIQSTKKPPH